ncbi:hypothetical protein [Aeromonas simiae]|nr:hypothetical protein [Aeromonas simiae]
MEETIDETEKSPPMLPAIDVKRKLNPDLPRTGADLRGKESHTEFN